MRERFERTIVYLIAGIMFYYFLPIACVLIGRENAAPIFVVLPMLDVCAAMAIGFMFGRKNGGDWLMSIELAVVFIPCIYMYYNSTAWIFTFLIAVCALFATMLGTVFKNRLR